MSSPYLLNGNVDTRDQELETLRQQLRQLDEALRMERLKTGQMEVAMRELRHMTKPFYQLLKAIHGEIDAMVKDSATVIAPQFDQKWEAWKQKLGVGTAPARVIDALLTHGPLNRSQLREAGELGWSTLDAATARLKNLSLIEKVGDRWNLKQ